MTTTRSIRACVIVIATIAVSTGAAQKSLADSFPSRPVTLIVPFPAGGPSDVLARVVAQVMGRDLKQSVVVENVAGASGTIGLARVAKAVPDGYTLGFGTIGTHVANAALFKRLPYDPASSFEPIGLAGTAPTMLVAKTALPVSNLKEFVAYVQANRAGMTYGSAGIGSISHYACVVLLSSLKLDVTHAPYRGVAPAMNDLMGGHIDFMCDQSTTALPQIAGGKIKAVAMLTDGTLPQLPELGTAASAGYKDVNIRSWNALFAPKGTPASIVKRLNGALSVAVADAEVKARMQKVGVDLPADDNLKPAAVSDLIAIGLKRDVPALRARGEYLD